jgi:hypothetical protein
LISREHFEESVAKYWIGYLHAVQLGGEHAICPLGEGSELFTAQSLKATLD